MRSSVGSARRASISAWQRRKISGTSRSMTVWMPSGFMSGSPAPSVWFISRAQIASSSGAVPMNEPITRATTGWATSPTRSHVSRPSRRSSTPRVISRMAGSCSAMRRGVKPRWKSALSRSCLGGSIPMNIACISSSGMIASVSSVKPVADENVSQSRETAWTSSAVVTDQKPASSGYSVIFDVQWTGHCAAHLLEQLVRRPVQPVLAVGDQRVLDGRHDGFGGHGLTLCQSSRSKTSSRPSRSSICSPTATKPSRSIRASDATLSGATEARTTATLPCSRAWSISQATAAVP